MTYCWAVPHFNHSNEFEQFLPRLIESGLPCIVVDDGSDAHHLEKVRALLVNLDQFHLFEQGVNRGKGAAVIDACTHAHTLGFTHIIQIDADGQHNTNDVDQFIALSHAHPNAIISGLPLFDESAPSARVYGRKVTTFFVALETMSLQIKDALFGYRVYPVRSMQALCDAFFIGVHMDFDTDIIVKSVWLGLPVHFINSRVQYQPGATSHFHYWRDNKRLIGLHCRLLFQALYYVPKRLIRKLTN